MSIPQRIPGVMPRLPGVKKKPLEAVLPEIVEASGDAAPSILLQGVSGTGKTKAISDLLAAGRKFLVVAVEDKIQSLMRYRPHVLWMGAPVVEKATGAKRMPTASEVWSRLLSFCDRLGAGEIIHPQTGEPFEGIAGDGLMEAADVCHRHFKEHKPVSQAGRDNTFAMYDEIGMRMVDLFKAIRSASSAAAQQMGTQPLAQVWTIGEVPRRSGEGYEPALPGRVAPQKLPFQFEQVLRLAVRKDPDTGARTYIASTVGEEGLYEAKTPDIYEPELLNWNFETDFYQPLLDWYARGKPEPVVDRSGDNDTAA